MHKAPKHMSENCACVSAAGKSERYNLRKQFVSPCIRFTYTYTYTYHIHIIYIYIYIDIDIHIHIHIHIYLHTYIPIYTSTSQYVPIRTIAYHDITFWIERPLHMGCLPIKSLHYIHTHIFYKYNICDKDNISNIKYMLLHITYVACAHASYNDPGGGSVFANSYNWWPSKFMRILSHACDIFRFLLITTSFSLVFPRLPHFWGWCGLGMGWQVISLGIQLD